MLGKTWQCRREQYRGKVGNGQGSVETSAEVGGSDGDNADSGESGARVLKVATENVNTDRLEWGWRWVLNQHR